MKMTVIGLTKEVDSISESDLEDAKVFSGKNAGICYMKESYFNSDVTDNAKARNRFTTVSTTNHHSISDHSKVEVLFEGISKMLAIVLNSLQDYATSEKSGRYTVMTSNSAKEQELYDKWKGLYQTRISELYPDLGEKMTEKLAQENARYVLSVFTRSTSMGYSTSLRQWNYIYDWCKKYTDRFCWHHSTKDGELSLVYWGTTNEVSFFELELYKDFVDLMEFIKNNLYVEEFRDPKDRCFEFLTQLSGDTNHPMTKYHVIEADANMGRDESRVSEDDYLGITYSVSYPTSFVHIAQAERHRTLKYFMQFNPNCSIPEFYVPESIRGTDLEKEWLSDLESVKELVPQATMVGIIETGHISDFILKCKERLCGRAQLEIMKQTKKTAERFIDEAENGNPSKSFLAYIEQIQLMDRSIKTKCQMIGACKEPCRWFKEQEVFTRLI